MGRLKISQHRREMLDRRGVTVTDCVEVRRGAGTCDDPCILGRVLDSAFMKARVRLSCSNSLIYTGHHKFRRHASSPRAAARLPTALTELSS